MSDEKQAEQATKPDGHRFSNSKEVRQEVLLMAQQGQPTQQGQPPAMKPLTLAQKILDIQKSVPTVRKLGKNREHNYSFLQIEDAVKSVNKMLSARDLIVTQTIRTWEIIPHTGGKGYISKVLLVWTLEDALTCEKREYLVPGEGYDTTDKGTPKAITASRKQFIITAFNLAVGNDPEAQGFAADREDAKASAKAVGDRKLAEAASRGSQTAVDAISQVVPEKKILISRPEEHNGNYIVVTGFTAAPQLEKYFDDTDSKRFKTKKDLVPYWRVPSEYEKGLIALCNNLGIEVEG